MTFTPPSLLSFSGSDFDVSDYALRGLSASLTPIAQTAQIERNINGGIVDLSNPSFRKYRIQISCTDQESPGFAAMSSFSDGIWPGSFVTVTLPPQLGSADPLTIDCVVAEPWQESLEEYAADNSWQLVLEQI